MKRYLSVLCAGALFFFLTHDAQAQEFTIRPEVLVPVAESTTWFQFGVGQEFALGWALQGWTFSGTASTVWLTDAVNRPVLFFAFKPRVAYGLAFAPGWQLALTAAAGESMSSLGNFSLLTANPVASAGLSLRVELAPTLVFSAGAEYEEAFHLLHSVVGWASFTIKEFS